VTTLGFIGLGVMGEPMCRNLAQKSRARVLGFDLSAAPLERLRAHGVEAAADIAELCAAAEMVFLSLPGGSQVEGVCGGERGLVALARAGQTFVDLGTSPPRLARALETAFAARGAGFADAPVARTRQAAEAGTLSVMVGGEAETFARIQPYLACFATDIAHCGASGAGQVVKILNNMVLFQTVAALAEARALALSAGVEAQTLFGAFVNGSADSFALRNHGMKAVLPQLFPTQAFSTEYALKDLRYALELGVEAGLQLPGAQVAESLLTRAIAEGFGEQYWPVISKMVRGDG
jgi:3-hydroxyisobutyrate dehydrogenase-like beta-hydroxyacid dehydrogenase